ncbi:hypothetical protein D9756_009358 [Leucocoprinus leucothites]|uniref:Uncharacterized protein n=1 Tax=Leucocoprinus leucothites TaxID=201217 RepID=A0A8H5CY45_9AGAR|nr:hypothetical protein D9756_009358 [Leucoagaricus leucothites]
MGHLHIILSSSLTSSFLVDWSFPRLCSSPLPCVEPSYPLLVMASNNLRLGSHSNTRQNQQRLTINPSSPCPESFSPPSPLIAPPSNGGRTRRPRIKHLSLISGEDGSTFMHPSLPPFLSTLTSVSTLHISWHTLDWDSLPNHQREALIRLISLESLDQLEIVASQNFPLDILRRFNGVQLHLTFTGTLTRRISTLSPPLSPEAPVSLRALERLSLVGQRNIVAFMDHFQNQPEFRDALRSLEFLSITCIDDQAHFEPERNLELVGHFLRFLDGSRIREIRVQDERPNAVIGHSLGLQDLPSLREVWNMEAHLDWFTLLLSGLSRGPPSSSSSSNLTSLDITYQVLFSRPPRWLKALIESMGQLWRELDGYLAQRLPRLQQVNLGFQFHGVGGHEQWMQFNAENQPSQLNERGLDCSFWVRDI